MCSDVHLMPVLSAHRVHEFLIGMAVFSISTFFEEQLFPASSSADIENPSVPLPTMVRPDRPPWAARWGCIKIQDHGSFHNRRDDVFRV